MIVGDLRIDSVLDGVSRQLPTESFAGGTDEDWALHRDLLDDEGMLQSVYGGFLVRAGDRNVLVDLGWGPRPQGGAFLASLAKLGLSPAEITDVVFTHLHVDHVGWATDEQQRPMFPAATYRCAAADWNHFMVEQRGIDPFGLGYTTDQLLIGASERFDTWETDAPLLSGIDVRAAPGHTPGSSVIIVSSGTERALLLGDVVHCPIQMLEDEWGVLYDVDPELARRTRIALNKELEDGSTSVAGAHFPGAQFGRLVRAEGRRRWVV